MTTCEILKFKSQYNIWMNHQLYEICAELTDSQRKRDLGAFFKSIHGTFNHIYLVDTLWLSRCSDSVLRVGKSLGDEVFSDFEDLHLAHTALSQQLSQFVEGLSESDLDEPVTYNSMQSGKQKSLPLGLLLFHLFNHQTHHRGQLTAMISQYVDDFGSTDMIFMPLAEVFFKTPVEEFTL